MTEAGLRIPWSMTVESLGEVEAALADGRITLPAIVRPAFTMGGQGGGVGETETELRQVVSEGLAASPINQVLVEESVIGWGEFELEVMRDRNDNVGDHLLDRERRPDGRPHRRLGHRRARPRPSPTRSTRTCATRRSR